MTQHRSALSVLALALACLTCACDGGPAIRTAEASATDSTARTELERTRHDSIVRSRPGYIVDSILPVEEEIRRFQATLGSRPAGFTHGAPSRAALVEAFARALEHDDPTALVRLVVDRAEFGYLIYPTSPNADPPYRQSPQLVWLSRSASTDKAMGRLLARFGGRPLAYEGVSCPAPPEQHGPNTIWSDCVMKRIQPNHAGDALRMFGPIVRHNGQHKFLSLTNGL